MGEMPRRRSRRLNPPCFLDGLSDDLVLRLFARAPFMTHGSLHAVCRRLKTLLRSPEFLQQRVETGLVEHGIVIAAGEKDGRGSTDCSMFTGGRLRPIAPLRGPRRAAFSAIVEDEDGQPEMWVMGGVDDIYNDLATVEAYSIKTNSWRSCLPLREGRWDAVSGVVGGRLVVAGGCAGGEHLTSVEAYTPTGWTPLPPLPHTALDATACVLNGRLYVMGGGDLHDKLQVLEMSEENEFSWRVKADLPARRHSAASCALDDKVWLIGGRVYEPFMSITATVLVYEIRNDTWATGPPLPHAIKWCQATIHDGEIHVTGYDEQDEEKAFCYRGEEWVEVERLQDAIFPALQSLLLG